ncbi:MAG: hypothetical protein RQ733_08465 [Methyloprofundus sp.]|nr:hypothetical protein [Methyloprofundus sp.]MDT8425994.1 hypothetical protein [Methyloprofundus sp.]
MQLLVDSRFYADDCAAADNEGWTRIKFIVALSYVMPEPARANSRRIKTACSDNWQLINISKQANQATISNKQGAVFIIATLTALNWFAHSNIALH